MKIIDLLNEKLNRTGSNELVIFDIDDTLLHTTAKINVIKDGKVVRSLTNQEFNNYKLGPGEEFDFGEFRDATKFEEESVPIGPMLDKLRSDLSSGKNVVMLTARADFDNQKAVWRTFKRHGIDINRDVHLYRAGNQPGNESPAIKKAIHVNDWLKTGKYNKVVMYDDSEKNLTVFKSLEKRFPDVSFEAHHVSEKGETRQIEERKKKRRKYKSAAYGPGPYGWYGFYPGYSGEVGTGDGGIEENLVNGKNLQDKADEWRDWQLKMLPRKMEMLSKLVKGWVPSEADHITAIKAGYNAMRNTGDVKDAAKAIADTFEKIQQQQGMTENFADGKVKGKSRPGRVKRAGASCNGSVTDLRSRAKNVSGEKAKMYHWCANMKSGRNEE